MEREILFRGKRVDNGEWVVGNFVKYQPCASKDEWIVGIVPDYASSLYLIEVDIETVSRYTGLTDKNGRKIFEGDVIRYTTIEYSDIYIVRWDITAARFAVYGLGLGEKIPLGDFVFYDAQKCEVIGNIHDGGVEI